MFTFVQRFYCLLPVCMPHSSFCETERWDRKLVSQNVELLMHIFTDLIKSAKTKRLVQWCHWKCMQLRPAGTLLLWLQACFCWLLGDVVVVSQDLVLNGWMAADLCQAQGLPLLPPSLCPFLLIIKLDSRWSECWFGCRGDLKGWLRFSCSCLDLFFFLSFFF